VVVAVAAAPRSHAATFTVTTTVFTLDFTPGDGVCLGVFGCSLRGAIMESNALPGPDSITLPAGIHVMGSRMQITEDVTIVGAGQATSIIRGRGGGNGVSGLIISSAATVAIENLTLTRLFAGRGDFDGGAILNHGSLTLTDVTVSRNRTASNGGGIANTATGDLTLINATLFRNKALHGSGGAIANGGTLTIIDSTFERNRAIDGGGLVTHGPVTATNVTFAKNNAGIGGGISNLDLVALTNCTFKRNRAKQDGGALVNRPDLGGEAHLVNCTLADNTALRGGAIGRYPQVGDVNATMHNTIVVGRRSCSSSVNSLGHNLDSETTCGLSAAGDQSAVNPLLEPLDDYGGPTQTLALPPGSAAVDAGDPAGCPAADQRGVPRPQGSACDIGAFELQPAP
jgi:hypothetical protein